MLKKILVVLASMILLFTGCGEKNGAKKVKEELIIAQDGESKSLDIHQGNDGFSLRANRLIYSRLVEADENMQIHPGLAESWQQLDDRTMQFKLRKGIKFHNGDDFTAEDVKFSFERMMNSPRIAFVLPPIERIDVVDDYTVNIVTKTPFGPLLAHLSHPALGMVSKKLLTENPEALKEKPIGTGSYKFKEWIYGDKLVLEKNEDFYDKNERGLKYIIFKNVVEASNRAIGLETGEIDIATPISSVDEENIKNNPKLQLLTKPSISYTYIGMNMTKAPLNDIRVRKAINYAIDKQAIIDVILNGNGKIATSPIAPGVFGFTDKTKNYEYNVEKAKELMKEAGYENGFTTSILVFSGEANTQTAEIVQAYLKEIGIDMTIETLEWGTYLQKTAQGEHQALLGGWVSGTSDADIVFFPLLHSSSHGGAGNRAFYTNKKLDKIIEQAQLTSDPKERKELFFKAQEILQNDAPFGLLLYKNENIGINKRVKGFEYNPTMMHNLKDLYIEK